MQNVWTTSLALTLLALLSQALTQENPESSASSSSLDSSEISPQLATILDRLRRLGKERKYPVEFGSMRISDRNRESSVTRDRAPSSGSLRKMTEKRDDKCDNSAMLDDSHKHRSPLSSAIKMTAKQQRKDPYFERVVMTDYDNRERRKFPEIDSRGFDEDIFDEGFGEWSPMKRSMTRR